jgi:hypothetical protein
MKLQKISSGTGCVLQVIHQNHRVSRNSAIGLPGSLEHGICAARTHIFAEQAPVDGLARRRAPAFVRRFAGIAEDNAPACPLPVPVRHAVRRRYPYRRAHAG